MTRHSQDLPRSRRSPRRILLCCVAGTLAITIAGCTGSANTLTTPAQAPNTTTTIVPRIDDGQLSIGVWLPTTGPGASLGEPMVRAVRDQITEINNAGGVLGAPIQVSFADENSETGLTNLLTTGVDAIVGPASSLVALSQLGSITQPDSGVITCSPTASALRLDNFPDNNYFFRTIPSDSLQMAAIAQRAQVTGVNSVSIGYLDDPYGRGLVDALTSELSNRRIGVVHSVGFAANQQDLSTQAANLLSDKPGLVVILADADDGGRILSAMSTAVGTGTPPAILVNDSLSGAGATMEQLPRTFREKVNGVAPPSLSRTDPTMARFAANASDCVTLIALAATQVGTDNPARLRSAIAAVSSGGRVCTSYADCVKQLVDEDLNIDFNGLSGTLELSAANGDPQHATFNLFEFGPDGTALNSSTIEI